MKTPSILCIGTHYPRYESFITELRKSFHIYAFRSLEIPEGDDSAVTFIDDVAPINCMPEDFTTAATAMVDIRTRLQGLLNPSCNITQTVPVTPQLERYYYQMIYCIIYRIKSFVK